VYYITVQGNNRQSIFRDHHDQRRYVELLGRYQGRFGCRLYGFILLTNHLHIIIETPKGNVGRFMQGLGTSYASYFNRRYNRRGTLFEGRYRSVVVPRDEISSLTRRIHPICRLEPLGKVRRTLPGPDLVPVVKASSARSLIKAVDLRRAEEIIKQVSRSLGMGPNGDMQGKRRQVTARHLAMYVIRRETHLPLRLIGTLLGVKSAAVAIAVGKVEKRLNDGGFPGHIENLLKAIALPGISHRV